MFDEKELEYVATGYRLCHDPENEMFQDVWAEKMGPDGVQIMKPNPDEAEQPLVHVRMVYGRAVQYLLLGAMRECVEDPDNASKILSDMIYFVAG